MISRTTWRSVLLRLPALLLGGDSGIPMRPRRLTSLGARSSTGQAPDHQAPAATTVLAAHELVGRIDGDELRASAIERATSVSRPVVLRDAERLEGRLAKADRALLAAVQRPLRPPGPTFESDPQARRET